MTEGDLLYRAILANPADDTARLAYADWLDETATRDECSECKNYVVEGHVPSDHNLRNPLWLVCPTCNGVGSISDGKREWAEFIRLQVEIGQPFTCRYAKSDTCFNRRFSENDVARTGCEVCRKRAKLILKELYWLENNRRELEYKIQIEVGLARQGHLNNYVALFDRGFISQVKLPLRDFMRDAAALFRAYPINFVVLTDRYPVPSRLPGRENKSCWSLIAHDPINPVTENRPHRIPYEIYNWIKLDRLRGFPQSKDALSNDEAIRALSNACVHYGRFLAGLDPVEVQQ